MLVLCPYCNKRTERTSIQTRLGADEPATVSDCACRLQASVDFNAVLRQVSAVTFAEIPTELNLSPSMHTELPPVLRRRFSRSDARPLLRPAVTRVAFEYEIRMTAEMTRGSEFVHACSSRSVYSERGFSCLLSDSKGLAAYKIRERSDGSGCVAKRTLSSEWIAPGSKYAVAVEKSIRDRDFNLLASQNHDSAYSVTVEEHSLVLGNWIIRHRTYEPDRSSSLEIEWTAQGEPAVELVQKILTWFYCSFYDQGSLRRFISRQYMQTVEAFKRPVYDQRSLLKAASVFMIKVDGEASLVIDGGYFWFTTRFNSSLSVTGFKAKQLPTAYSQTPDMILCESLPDSRLVFIEIVAQDGKPLPPNRDYSAGVESIPYSFAELSIILRREHETLESAETELLATDLPADGVIGISHRLGTTYRIKKPTVDLLASEGKLVTSHERGTAETGLETLPGMLDKRVYECELEISLVSSRYWVRDFVYRPDKAYANSKRVLKAVVMNACGSPGYAQAIRKQVTDLSMQLRQQVYDTAFSSRVNGGLVIDVGSGRLQAKSFLHTRQCSLLLCDPKLRMSSLGDTYRGTDLTSMTSKHKLVTLQKLNSKRTEVAVFRGKVEDLFSSSELRQFVIENEIPIVFSFSVSHVLDFYIDMAQSGAKMLGCGYFYDRADEDGIVIEDFGVSMRVIDSDNSIGKFVFGTENVFVERAVVTAEMQCTTLRPALRELLDVIEVPDDVQTIISHVYCFTT